MAEARESERPPSTPGGMDVEVFTGGAFVENGYLVRCTATDRVAVVDPGAAAPAMVSRIRTEGWEVEAIYLTHAHIDHVEGLPAVRELTDAPIFLHPADRPLYDRAEAQAGAFGMEVPGPLPLVDSDLEPGTSIRVGECSLEVKFAPGHAPGHVIFHSPSDAFALVGDVIFQGSIGRTDLPGGDFQQLIASIRQQVLTLPDDTRLLPGHGPETSVKAERRGNPFLISQSPSEFA